MVRGKTIFYVMVFWCSFIFFILVNMVNEIHSSIQPVDPYISFTTPKTETLFETPPPTNELIKKAAQLDRIIESDREYVKKKMLKQLDLVTLHHLDPKLVKEKMESKETNIRKEIDIVIEKISKKYKMDPRLIKLIIGVESEFNYKAVSKEKAKGLMQIVPDTARKLGVKDRFNPVDNIDGGVRYIRYLLKLYKGDLKLALAAYNAGPGRVQEYGFTIPPFKETQDYVSKIYNQYTKGGNG